MNKYLLVLLVLSGLSNGIFGDCTWPNGTDTTNHWWQSSSNVFNIYSVTTVNVHGQYQYPIHVGAPFEAYLNVTISGSSISKIQEDILIWEWSSSGCKWNMVPLFGLLNNLNGCNNGFTCPVQPGNQRLRVYLDFTKYPDVLNWLNNNTSYQMQATLTDKSTGNKVVITDQARIFKP